VADVYPDLVAHSADGQIETVKYQVLDSMLLNEVQRLNNEMQRLNDEHLSEVQRLNEQNQALLERLSRLEAAMAKAAGGAGVQ
jgi:flagellar biosynthesis/type III secretory pathway chaperone